jgi:hypothetical protein
MLCGATQHSNTDPFDRTSPAIPIGPHWMIIWPYDAARDGLPNTVRDAGAWVMFDGTPRFAISVKRLTSYSELRHRRRPDVGQPCRGPLCRTQISRSGGSVLTANAG